MGKSKTKISCFPHRYIIKYDLPVIFIIWLSLAFDFHAIYLSVGKYILYANETHILSKIAIITVLIALVSDYVFKK